MGHVLRAVLLRIRLYWGDLNERQRAHLDDLGVDGRIMLQ